MEDDDEGIVARHQARRAEFIDSEIEGHGGRIVKTMGDGLLVEFASPVEAVRCAVEVQRGRCQSKIPNTWSGQRTAQIDSEKCRKINDREIRF